ncbi:F0F1 ATP synthase subunit B [Streptococcus sobrinus]|uniref:ATP synthase subunit b n=2 Tax=Streptococcus sobrinus TaxID=1310 RepID=U2JEL0_9STRE|nr:F0F1 ATP synthase subunit B [Streptococcus sobrinus]AWN61825.1 ATP synthase F0 subunit B [Streptococcus sobrinus]AWN63696.1 ATP synthase F0 subunit B [Streptococcus sobrinus]ERJ78472.1 ATP synthase F0, B subunit [Streptococcus sobrinus W1703]OZV23394.1 ATP synthase F0 subunit B [Streptococcus sobrinus]SQG20371.1 ATP synthase F0 subunit B [Streptococcus sobrinus]
MSILFNSTTIGDIIITTGSVLILYWLIRKFAWTQITGIFEERANKINQDIYDAENARKEAQELAEKRQEQLNSAKDDAAKIIDSAKETGNAQSAKILAETRDEVSRLKEKANQDIAQDKAEALSSVKGDVADLTVLLAEKVMTKNLDKSAQSELIDQYLDQLGDA